MYVGVKHNLDELKSYFKIIRTFTILYVL